MSGITVTLPKPCTHIPLCWLPKEAWDAENVVSPNVVKLFALGVVLAGWEDSPTEGFTGSGTRSDEQAAPNSSVPIKHAKGNILVCSNSASCELVVIKGLEGICSGPRSGLIQGLFSIGHGLWLLLGNHLVRQKFAITRIIVHRTVSFTASD